MTNQTLPARTTDREVTREQQGILLTEQQAAASLSINPRTLQTWRASGGGPLFVRISRRCIRYRREDLDQWTNSRVKSSTSQP